MTTTIDTGTQALRPTTRQYTVMGVVIWGVYCLLFGLISKNIHSIADLLKRGNLVAMTIYFLPTYMLCCAMLDYFTRWGVKRRMLKTVLIGMPAGIALVIGFFYLVGN